MPKSLAVELASVEELVISVFTVVRRTVSPIAKMINGTRCNVVRCIRLWLNNLNRKIRRQSRSMSFRILFRSLAPLARVLVHEPIGLHGQPREWSREMRARWPVRL
jgi:hypothetical protein